jgi:hypothetical protein
MKSNPIPEFFDQEIEPKALCRNCEYYDGGGLTVEGKVVSEEGDCRNPNSPWFRTSGNNACRYFFPCSTRWPEADHG